MQNEYNQENGYDEEDDEEDEIMSDFDMPFYEDPKFANLYYYGDGSEPKLSLSTSLPLMLNDEKLSKLKKKEAKKREQEERKQRRKLYKKTQKPSTRTTSNVDNDEYIFNVFFNQMMKIVAIRARKAGINRAKVILNIRIKARI